MSKKNDDEDFDILSSSSSSSNDENDNETVDYDSNNEDDISSVNDSLNYNNNNTFDEYENDEDINYEVNDDEPIEDYLQKINNDVESNIISNFHQELKQHNNEEIELLLKITRNKDGDIVDDLHKTIQMMTKYERCRILSERTVQLNSGAQTFLDNDEIKDIMDNSLIAIKELNAKKIPFIIKRTLPDGHSEYWNSCDLELIFNH
jgi:DNA-directed RNA polymerase I, II, and III subunit RPABC2